MIAKIFDRSFDGSMLDRHASFRNRWSIVRLPSDFFYHLKEEACVSRDCVRLYAAGLFCQGMINYFTRVQAQNLHTRPITYKGCLLSVQTFGCVISTAAAPNSSPGLSLTTHRRFYHRLIRLTRPAPIVSLETAETLPFHDNNVA